MFSSSTFIDLFFFFIKISLSSLGPGLGMGNYIVMHRCCHAVLFQAVTLLVLDLPQSPFSLPFCCPLQLRKPSLVQSYLEVKHAPLA